ncbi:hypothetical protein PENTCL1PPCAC_3770, partial [Pristionchus entomophagus]
PGAPFRPLFLHPCSFNHHSGFARDISVCSAHCCRSLSGADKQAALLFPSTSVNGAHLIFRMDSSRHHCSGNLFLSTDQQRERYFQQLGKMILLVAVRVSGSVLGVSYRQFRGSGSVLHWSNGWQCADKSDHSILLLFVGCSEYRARFCTSQVQSVQAQA